MADFVSGFWNAYVMVLLFLSISFCVFVLVSNTTKRTSGPVGLHDHIWDETLQEYNNPLPRWWMYMFWITIIFAIVYLSMYPGFGNNQGKLGWPPQLALVVAEAGVHGQIDDRKDDRDPEHVHPPPG